MQTNGINGYENNTHQNSEKNIDEIIDEYFDVRLSMYNKRKEYLIKILDKFSGYLTAKKDTIKGKKRLTSWLLGVNMYV